MMRDVFANFAQWCPGLQSHYRGPERIRPALHYDCKPEIFHIWEVARATSTVIVGLAQASLRLGASRELGGPKRRDSRPLA
jgi:hypothetical protein